MTARRVAGALRRQWAAWLALVAVLSSGAAFAVAPRGSVVSSSIKDGAVKTADLDSDAVKRAELSAGAVRADEADGLTGSDLADGGVTGADVADGTLGPAQVGGLGSAQIADGTVTGTQVVESTLVGIATAARGGTGRSAEMSSICEPTTNLFITCGTVSVTTGAPGRLLMLASSNVYNENPTQGGCQFTIDGFAFPASYLEIREPSSDATNAISMAAVTDPVGPGTHTLVVQCQRFSGSPRLLGGVVSLVSLNNQ